MERDEKFIPIITLVVYCGTEHGWDGAKCLHDLLEIDERLKQYVTNYTLNLYDCHAHDTFDEYRTGLRQLFEVVRYGKDKEELSRVMEENREAYSLIDRETKELLEVVADIKIPEKYCGTERENGVERRRYNMCKAFEDYRLEGKEEGRQEGRAEQLIQLVCRKLQKCKPAAVIAEELEEEFTVIERVIEAQRQVGSYDAGQICKVYMALC